MQKTIKKIIEKTLKKVDGLYSKEGVDLIYETGNTESRYMALEQGGGGPALGFFQCEPATMDDVWKNYVSYRAPLKVQLWELGYKEDDRMTFLSNIAVQAALCRLHYRRDSAPIPSWDDLEAQAEYWKRVYNTVIGKGTVTHFMKANGYDD